MQRTMPLAAAWAEAAWLTGQPAKGLSIVERCVASLERDNYHGWGIAELTFWHQWLKARVDSPLPAFDARVAPQSAVDVRSDPHLPFPLQIAGAWAAAAAHWESLGCPYEAACARAQIGTDTDLREALKVLQRLGARPAAASVRQRLREMGARGISRGPHSTTREGPNNLTRREVEVLDLVAEGLRNAEIAGRLFISAKTVERHMSSILAKLGVPTRLEAVRTLAGASVGRER
jgi:DNA-binding CsgD family transcriptional regulator